MASRAGLADVKAAKRDLKEYGFLAWLEKHLQLHERKTNLWSIRLDNFEAGSTDHSASDNTKSLNTEHDLNCARKKDGNYPNLYEGIWCKANSNSNNLKKLKLFNKLNCLLYKVSLILILWCLTIFSSTLCPYQLHFSIPQAWRFY